MNLSMADSMEHAGLAASTGLRYEVMSILLIGRNRSVADRANGRYLGGDRSLRCIKELSLGSADTHEVMQAPSWQGCVGAMILVQGGAPSDCAAN